MGSVITCCFDVGLRNLALCIISTLDKRDISKYKIEMWDVFNILDQDDFKCKSYLKNGKVCNKKCSMKYFKDNITEYSCKLHFPKDISKNRSNNFKRKTIDKYQLQDIAKAFINKIEELYNNNEIFRQITDIQIELQPTINQKMKFTSHILYGKLVDLYKHTNTTIKFVRAEYKLKVYTGPYIECKIKNPYKRRKWLSIEYAKWILENKFNILEKNKWSWVFDNYKKLDDISDTFCMGINSLLGTIKDKNKNGSCVK